MDKGERRYTLPPIELLNQPQEQDREGEQELLERARQITAAAKKAVAALPKSLPNPIEPR